jgi:hypothetical protein
MKLDLKEEVIKSFEEKENVKPKKWNAQKVQHLFKEILNLPQYLESLEKENIDGSKLVKTNTFEKIYIMDKAHIKLISQLINSISSNCKKKSKEIVYSIDCCEMNQENSISLEEISNWSRERLEEWLNKNDLNPFINIFQIESINSYVLFDLNEKYLNQMGINNTLQIKRFFDSLHDLNAQCYHQNHFDLLEKCFVKKN